MSTSSQPRIVLIEDNPADINLLKQALDHQGREYSLHVLRDGESALHFLEEHCRAESPCLIVLDLHLPRYDGTQVLRAIRHNSVLRHVDVAILTTVASPAEEIAVRQLGISLYARKPVDWDDMLDLGRQLIDLCFEDKVKAVTRQA